MGPTANPAAVRNFGHCSDVNRRRHGSHQVEPRAK